MGYNLEVVRGPSVGTSAEVKGRVDIGRLPSIGLPLADSNISRNHGTFSLSGASLVYTDHSTNGTAVRRRGEKEMTIIRKTSVFLNPGDHILLGSSSIEVQSTFRRESLVPSESIEASAVYEHPFTRLAAARTGRELLREAFSGR